MNIFVVIVFYNPSSEDIASARQLAERWQGMIVDNSPQPCFQTSVCGKMRYHFCGSNVGIASAQNIGIREAMATEGVERIIFLDQDSRVAADYPVQISSEFDIVSRERPLAMLGPTVVNAATDDVYRSAFHSDTAESEHFVPRREIISSGSCMSKEAAEKVGQTDDTLFIDYVDFEWCWRAGAHGLRCGITPAVSIRHQVGQRQLKILSHGVIISSPQRYFYSYRNYLWLLRRSYVPRQWKVNTGVKLFLRFFYLPFVAEEGFSTWKNMCRGIRAGLRRTNKKFVLK